MTPPKRQHPFNAQQTEVIRRIASGETVAEIAEAMSYHPQHIRRIIRGAGELIGTWTPEQLMFSAARRWPALFQDIISNHGSLAGYNAHRKLGEIPVLCTMCLHARAEASRRSFGRSPGIHET